MPYRADGFCQPVEVMETTVVALEFGHVVRPGSKNEQRPLRTSLKAAPLRFPVLPDRGRLQVNHPESSFQGHALDAFLTFGDAGGDQHVSAFGQRDQPMAFCLPEIGLFRRYSVGTAMKEHLVFLRLAQKQHVAEGTIAHTPNNNTKRTLKQIGIFPAHQIAAGIVAEVAFPVVKLPITHEDMVVVTRLEERSMRCCS